MFECVRVILMRMTSFLKTIIASCASAQFICQSVSFKISKSRCASIVAPSPSSNCLSFIILNLLIGLSQLRP